MIAVLAYMTYSVYTSCLQLLHHHDHVNIIDQDVNAPMKQLFGFQRVELNPKENTTLIFDAGVETFMTVIYYIWLCIKVSHVHLFAG